MAPVNPNPTPTPPTPPDPREERLQELLLDRALYGLAAPEEAELQLLLSQLGRTSDDSFELAVAAADLAWSPSENIALPGTLKNRILAAGEQWCVHGDLGAPVLQLTAESLALIPAEPEPALTIWTRRAAHGAQRWGGWVAAAACLSLAVWAWNTRPLPGPAAAPAYAALVSTEPTTPEGRLLDLLLDDEADVIQVPLGLAASSERVGPDPIDAAGEVFWSHGRQEGFLRLTGLPPIDRPGDQYQLWVYDALRDSRYPVNGGVFDVPRGASEVLLPFDPLIEVSYATRFAITVERAGGVVVSTGDSLVAMGDLTPAPAQGAADGGAPSIAAAAAPAARDHGPDAPSLPAARPATLSTTGDSEGVFLRASDDATGR